MKKYALFTLLFAFSFATVMAQAISSGTPTFFTKADAFFKKNVTTTGVDYKGIKAAPADLNSLVSMIGTHSLAGQSVAAQKAFYLNAYNILVIKNVVDHYPIAKPLDVPNFFDGFTFSIAGQQLSLSAIENKVIRPTFKDARVHFALVCAARSCPPLTNVAFTAANVETQLQSLTVAAMNNNSFIRVDNVKQTVHYSEILDWYKDDFLAVSKTLLGYINTYRTVKIPVTYTQATYPYDWALNEKK